MELKIKRDENVRDLQLPAYTRAGDVAIDLVCASDIIIPAGQRATVSTGLYMEIPEGYAGLIWDRSGLSFKHGLTVLGGVIDSNYRGEIGICLFNTTDSDYELKRGERAAQMVIQPVVQCDIIEVDELSDTNRGDAAYGSSGK